MGARRGRWAAVLLAAAGGMAGLVPALLATAQPAWAFAYNIEISDNAYSPKVQPINKGDKVVWRMPATKGPHSVTSDDGGFDYKFGSKGAVEELRFTTTGEYSYHCTYQDGMTGTIVVNDPDAPTTTTTAPPTTTTTARPTTTTTTAPLPTTTTAPPTTTSAPSRPPAEVPPPVPSTAAAPPPTLATSSTTTVPPTTATTTAPATTTSAPPDSGGDQVAAPPTSASAPPTTESTTGGTGEDQKTAAGPARSSDGKLDGGAVTLIALLVAVGLFGAWTLIRVRPGRI